MWRGLFYAAPSLALAWLVTPDLLRPYPVLGPDGHMRASLSHAVNATVCGSRRLSGSFDIPAELTRHPDELFLPIGTVIERCCGSVQDYCGSLRVNRIDNENALMWLMRAVLAVNPSVSVAGIGEALAVLRFLILGLLLVALSSAGASVAITAVVAVVTSGILRNQRIYQYHYSPFLLMLPLFLIALYVLLLGRPSRRPVAVAVTFAAMGLITAFCANMRTSHIPIYLALFVVFLLAWRRSAGQQLEAASTGLLASAVVAFVAACVAGYAGMTAPMDIPGAEGFSRHTIAHPLVLGLAEPPSDLSRREGLKWEDLAGLEIAQRVDPNATYLSAAYESALTRYYVGLWRRHPGEMLGVYVSKFRMAGSGVLEDVAHLLEHRGLPSAAGRWLARQIVSGFLLLGAAAGTSVFGWLLYRRTNSRLAFAWSQFSIATTGTILESALIMPRFYVFYHSVLLLYVMLTPALIVQLAADRCHAGGAGRARRLE